MKAFKFTSKEDNLFWAFSGKDEEEAKQTLIDYHGEVVIDDVEEIPESQWDEKMINMWVDNDLDTEPFKISIREAMLGDMPTELFTNDLDF